MNSHLFHQMMNCGLVAALLTSQAGCSSVLRASRAATSGASVVPVDESVLERAKLVSQHDRNQPFSGSSGMERMFPRANYLLPAGYQWIFVQKENTAHGQSAGHWIAVPPGQDFPR